MTVEVKLAESELDFVLAFRAYKDMHEGGTVPGKFDADSVARNLYRFMQGPGSCVLIAMDGKECCGVLTLKIERMWSDPSYRIITDKGFFVKPDARHEGVGKALMARAAQVGDDLGLDVVITIFNIKRKRGVRTTWGRVGETIGYSNRGAVLAHVEED